MSHQSTKTNTAEEPALLTKGRAKTERTSFVHGMSVDVEDYFQVWGFSDVISRQAWDSYEFRAGEITRQVLDLFDAANVKATFFTLGWVAERDPALIKDIVARGHELASHGYEHIKVFDQDAESFREDAGRTRKILEDIGGTRVTGYRAAGFSIDQRTPFAHQVLEECGYLYSSSTHPIAHDHYGDPNAPQTKYYPNQGSAFIEAPVATVDFMGRRMSCAGGGWFRAMPYGVSKKLFAQAEKDANASMVFYFHPWEIDKGQPRIQAASKKSKFRHYINIDKMPAKLTRLMEDFTFDRIDSVLDIDHRSVAA